MGLGGSEDNRCLQPNIGSKQGSNYPMVSVIIPMLNEEEFIAPCLDSVLKNDYPHNRLEVLVIDGGSTDNSVAIVQKYTSRYPFIKLINNPKKIQACALNIGLAKARGAIIIRMDAHTVYEADYIRQCVGLLQSNRADNIGGVQRPVGTNYMTNVIALATSSPFGTGDAKFRYATKEAYVDTVYLGAWYKKTLEQLGGFNEEWVINEDYELNYRLRAAGGRILLSPQIRCWYYVRGSLGKLARQYFRYGMWKVKTLVKHPTSLRWRQLAAPALIAGLLLSIFLIIMGWPLGWVLPGIYVMGTLIATTLISFKKGFRYFPILPIVFFILHFSWGIGFYFGLLRFGLPKISVKTIYSDFKESILQ